MCWFYQSNVQTMHLTNLIYFFVLINQINNSVTKMTHLNHAFFKLVVSMLINWHLSRCILTEIALAIIVNIIYHVDYQDCKFRFNDVIFEEVFSARIPLLRDRDYLVLGNVSGKFWDYIGITLYRNVIVRYSVMISWLTIKVCYQKHRKFDCESIWMKIL